MKVISRMPQGKYVATNKLGTFIVHWCMPFTLTSTADGDVTRRGTYDIEHFYQSALNIPFMMVT